MVILATQLRPVKSFNMPFIPFITALFKPKNSRPRSLSKDPVHDKDVIVFPFNGVIYKHFLHKDANLSKLFTREDPNHIHKTLGLLSVLSFFYRYGFCYNAYGNLGFNGPSSDLSHQIIDWATMAVHLCLAFSSILFRVPKKRLADKPMVIYEEYRQHAMVFTLRSFTLFSILMLAPKTHPYAIFGIVLLHHVLVDYITSIHGTEGNTAVRANAEKVSSFYKMVAKFYSLYQFLALGSYLFTNSRHIDMAYNAIIAIQSSAFMMTLYRKRIVRGKTHMAIYSFCLLLSAFHICSVLDYLTTGVILLAFFLRINLPRAFSNKYAIWTACLLLHEYVKVHFTNI